MSVVVLRNALLKADVPPGTAGKAAASILRAIEVELAVNGRFVLRGIGCIEVVPNQRKRSTTLIGGDKAVPLPVRVRFQASRELRKKIAIAYALPDKK
jgi:hypothetical protein